MMIKRLFIGFILLGWVLPAFPQQDPKAKEVLDKMARATEKWPSLNARFKYNYTNEQTKEKYNLSGEIWMSGNNYKIVIPLLGTDIYYDGSDIWTYMEESNEVTITRPDPSTNDFFVNNPMELFKIYDKDFKSKFLRDIPGTTTCEIDLYPLDLNRPYQRLRLSIDKTESVVKKAEATGKSGEVYQVELSDIKTNKEVKPEFFLFDKRKYPGVNIVDMRQ